MRGKCKIHGLFGGWNASIHHHWWVARRCGSRNRPSQSLSAWSWCDEYCLGRRWQQQRQWQQLLLNHNNIDTTTNRDINTNTKNQYWHLYYCNTTVCIMLITLRQRLGRQRRSFVDHPGRSNFKTLPNGNYQGNLSPKPTGRHYLSCSVQVLLS